MSGWAAEVVVDEAQARRLLESQFPELRPRELRLLGAGWDMTVWLADGEIAFRFPRRAEVVPGLLRELEVLPLLAPRLPLAVPNPEFRGAAEGGYPWPFWGARLIPGQELGQAGLDQAARDGLAGELAAFLRALHSLPVRVELPCDPMGRANSAVRAPRAREVLARLRSAGVWSAPPSADGILRAGEQLRPSTEAVLCHGDLHLRHLLVSSGRATGVIDWIDVCLAPRAADLPLYWALFSPAGRRAFTRVYGDVTADDLLRARVLALNLCAILAEYAHAEGISWLEREAVAGLERALIG